jgi:hypothetical protein
LEGECHALAAFGDHRAKKAGQAQSVIGFVTTGHGEPIAVPVCDGNTAEPLTVPAQGETLRRRCGITAVVCVGDRGMVKRPGKPALAAAGSTDIPALPPPPRRTLLRQGVLRPAWCPPHGHAGPHGAVRLVRRRSEAVRRTAHRRRHDQLATRPAVIAARQALVRTAHRAPPAAGRRTLPAWVPRHTLVGWGPWSLQEHTLIVTGDEAAQIEASRCDGGDV